VPLRVTTLALFFLFFLSFPSRQQLEGGNMSVESTMRYFVSNYLSYAVVVGASILKVPQILKVWQNNKAAGISLLSLFMELLSYIISTSWGVVRGLPFRDYGENFFITVQLIVLLLLVARLQKATRRASLVLATELLMLYMLASGQVPRTIHECALNGQVFFNMFSRVPQIYTNYQTRCRGQLSFLTFFLAFGGGVVRIMTTALNVPWEKGKIVMMIQFSVAAALNAIILAQMLYYGIAGRKSERENRRRTEAKSLKHQ
ncbi:PQ loop repeat, partial [Leishmania braziliensis]